MSPKPKNKVEWTDVVYGPVKSRRLGQSLGINLTPLELKVCNFSCGYCRVGVPSKDIADAEDFQRFGLTPENVKEAITRGLEYHSINNTPIDYVTIAGNGEPTLFPWFADIVDHLLQAKEAYLPSKPTAIFTNATRVNQREIQEAIYKLDRRFFKLDAGDERTFRRVNIPIRVSYGDITQNLMSLEDYELSMAITNGDVSNSESFQNPKFTDMLKKMRFTRLFIYDIDIPKTTSPKFNKKAERGKLEEVAEHLAVQLNKRIGEDVIILWDSTTRDENIPLYPQQIN